MAERSQAGQLQMQERKGDLISRAQEKDKTDTMLGMSQQRLGAANAARDSATKSIIGGVTGMAKGALGMVDDLGFNPLAGTGISV